MSPLSPTKLFGNTIDELITKVVLEPDAPQAEAQGSVKEWRPAAGEQVNQTISTHRAEREARYQHVERLHQQGLTSQQIAHQLGMNDRTVRHWREAWGGA